MKTLLLDFGGVCLITPFELHDRVERAFGVASGSLTWRGPFDPAGDILWQAVTAGEITERDYWAQRAMELGVMIGRPGLDTAVYMEAINEPPSMDLIRPDAIATVQEARAAGWRVGVLTNDLRAFTGPTWASRMAFFDLIDPLLDCSTTNILKPDPRAYRWAIESLGGPVADILFVDDQPINVQGAVAAGLETIAFDVTAAAASWSAIRRRLELTG